MREVALTAKIFRLPATASALVLPNDLNAAIRARRIFRAGSIAPQSHSETDSRRVESLTADQGDSQSAFKNRSRRSKEADLWEKNTSAS